MAHRIKRAALAAILVAFVSLAATRAQAQNYGPPGWVSPEPNYYAMPTGDEGLTAAMFPCPRPTPPLIGQTYITYQPLAPQQFMYLHHNTYVTSHGTGYTTTSVTYGHHFNFHPSLRNQAPGLHTPSGFTCPL
jgi:hypothetical protein